MLPPSEFEHAEKGDALYGKLLFHAFFGAKIRWSAACLCSQLYFSNRCDWLQKCLFCYHIKSLWTCLVCWFSYGISIVPGEVNKWEASKLAQCKTPWPSKCSLTVPLGLSFSWFILCSWWIIGGRQKQRSPNGRFYRERIFGWAGKLWYQIFISVLISWYGFHA